MLALVSLLTVFFNCDEVTEDIKEDIKESSKRASTSSESSSSSESSESSTNDSSSSSESSTSSTSSLIYEEGILCRDDGKCFQTNIKVFSNDFVINYEDFTGYQTL